MFPRTQLDSIPANVAAVLQELKQEEKLSNKNQSKLGRRVSLKQTKICSIPCFTEETLVNEDGEIEEAPFIQYLEERQNAKEPTLYALAKKDEAWLRIAES